jgi:hypothetical protein
VKHNLTQFARKRNGMKIPKKSQKMMSTYFEKTMPKYAPISFQETMT